MRTSGGCCSVVIQTVHITSPSLFRFLTPQQAPAPATWTAHWPPHPRLVRVCMHCMYALYVFTCMYAMYVSLYVCTCMYALCVCTCIHTVHRHTSMIHKWINMHVCMIANGSSHRGRRIHIFKYILVVVVVVYLYVVAYMNLHSLLLVPYCFYYCVFWFYYCVSIKLPTC